MYWLWWQSCMVHGGDGFAWVLHLDPNVTATLGSNGEGLGYAGIRNSLVVEFDTWYNPTQGDHFSDHVRCVRTPSRRLVLVSIAPNAVGLCSPPAPPRIPPLPHLLPARQRASLRS